ncbi:1-deoxy-D-xylulose-5-phosphate reductoisomerase [Desulfogranum marinum]|jgi:1-deoxy-D-xylulose-5-phosphate reductoisomerase|uniref:1-deoxy-D-xylulose-5-phosphate reductoisomerase n=1 Tax=Desulfogranum marinum TaxID=453220 RepID=UPI0019644D01|nr:1-deoxy-D-xylulose-5-phosphate reductoisomerase [Desulfogranum marinum]MBM9511210.1 1-deoxy-D-xylulose-5-phosphate reductoisomerase [Desulfogranum marinum]
MKTISLLGSTGSIGKNVLAVARRFPEQYRIAALTAGSNIHLLAEQVREFQPELVCIGKEGLVDDLTALLPADFQGRIMSGNAGNCVAAALDCVDMLVSAVVGSVGLLPALAAIEAGKDIGLANKETLVMAGSLIMQRAKEAGVRLFPIDSEHSAIFQALEAGRKQDVKKLLLTASGGPFRLLEKDKLHKVTPDQALSHPNWDMGRKISIDSATLMNKGLEVIEARWLFDVTPDQIEVVVHPQSVVHSLVEYLDGSVVAQLGIPDMQIPIAYALSYPERLDLKLSQLDLIQCGKLTFEAPDGGRFPALQMAYDALAAGGVQPAVLNAANEVAVDAFLDGRIGFTAITKVVAIALQEAASGDDMNLDAILAADHEARQIALDAIDRICSC